MASNIRNNTIYCDTAGDEFPQVRRIYGIIYTTIGTAGTFVLKDLVASSLAPILKIEQSATNDTQFLDLSTKPIVINNGLEVDALPSGASVTLIVDNK